jgi:anti-sigma factor RsiW
MNMKCKDARRLLVAQADGRPAGSQTDAVNAHLAVCAECRGLLAGLRADVALLRQVEDPPVPDGLAARVMGRVGSDAQGSPFVLRRSSFARLAVAAALLLVAVGLWLGAALGQGIFGSRDPYRDRSSFNACGLPVDGLLEQFLGEGM